MAYKFDKRVLVYLTTILLILFGIGLSSYQGSHALVVASNERSESRLVLEHIASLMTAVISAESGQRGYLLTGNTTYLKPYEAARIPIVEHVAALKDLFRSNPNALLHMAKLQFVLTNKLDELAHTIELRKNGKNALALQIVNSDEGRKYMDEIRHELIHEIRDVEEAKLKMRADRMDQTISDLIFRIASSSVLAILLLASIAFLLNRELRARRIVESVLQKEQQRLSDIITTQIRVATAGLSVEHVMNVIIEQTLRITGGSGAIIEIADERREFMVYKAAGGSVADKVGFRVRMEGSLSGTCFKTGELLRCDNTEADPRVDRDSCRKLNIASMIVVPLQFENNSIGVLKTFSDHVDAFNSRDLETMHLIAGLLSSSMAYAHQFEATQSAERTAVEASKLKSEFLANMSHEIRTPINGIMGMANLLEDTCLNNIQKDYTDSIQRSADALLSVINDILDFSKIEVGKLELEAMDFDFDQMISDIGKMISLSARSKGLQFILQSPGNWHNLFKSDQGRIRQILLNLLSNAVKFTHKGSVYLRILVKNDDPERTYFRFEVEDSGIGIPKDAETRLFQAFSQADASTTRRFGGTGLGLTISRQLAVLLGGTIGYQSSENKGSTFWVELTLEKGSTYQCRNRDTLVGISKTAHPSTRILVAEDHIVNQKVIMGYLAKMGFEAVVVNNGREALEALVGSDYDLVLMDCQMPELDGYEATALIRQSAHSFGDIPIIAMTANAIKGDRERCLAVGMNDYVSKPVKVKDLAATIERWLTLRANMKKGSAF
ncbi:MAG: CHASE3 domain-containing protein [Chitinophagaceae bacterium]|nr:CHASE3 domain-containing protein [Oligoflexus sp.]